ncbi:MAG: DUF2914 domain-containing protein [Balneolaceae bacterium]|nr:DUF2914 domain-containing protein [Balneolaceae bacterium]
MISRFRAFVRRHQKYLPVLFFIGGFIWDSLTLGRIDRLYDRTILSTYMILLSVALYMFNVADDGKWKDTFFEKYEEYLPLAIQFFLGALCSAFVIYFSRSISFSKTLSFFVILVILLFANEFLKQKISNKYLQFSAYFFVNFTFCTFFIPVLIAQMSTTIFIISGLISLGTTMALIIYIYAVSPTTRAEIHEGKTLGLVVGVYLMINTFYYFNLIPPVPLALESGMVAHDVEKTNGNYVVTYQKDVWYKFWRENRLTYIQQPGTNVYLFTSIFAPTDLQKEVSHRWKWKNPETGEWQIADNIGYEITGGRDKGYRGFTYKSNIKEGIWEVDVITEEGLVLGIIDFEIEIDSTIQNVELETQIF